MRRVFSWGLPLYAAIMTGIFVSKGLPDNNLRAAGDAAACDNVKAAALPPTPANSNAGSYPIPAPLAQPKHLFHVVIRYEGDGLPDQTMLTTALAAAGQLEDDKPKKAGKSKVAKARDTFQFIIRYEGDGIIDDNVAKVIKDYFASEKASDAPAKVQDTQKRTSVNSEQSENATRGLPERPFRVEHAAPAPAARGPSPATAPRGPAPTALPPAAE